MSTENKPTTPKQKILITLILVTAGLLVVSLIVRSIGGTEDGQQIDREECLQRGGVWDNTESRCYDNTANRFPQAYTAACTDQSAALNFVRINPDVAQLVLPGSPPDVYRLTKTNETQAAVTYRDTDQELIVEQSARQISVRRDGGVAYSQCELADDQPASAPDVSVARLGVDQTTRTSGIDITVNRIVEDSRCPVDAVCVQAGEVIVSTTLAHDNGLQEQPNISTGGVAYRFADRSVAIARVLPMPADGVTVDADNYQITFWTQRITDN